MLLTGAYGVIFVTGGPEDSMVATQGFDIAAFQTLIPGGEWVVRLTEFPFLRWSFIALEVGDIASSRSGRVVISPDGMTLNRDVTVARVDSTGAVSPAAPGQQMILHFIHETDGTLPQF